MTAGEIANELVSLVASEVEPLDDTAKRIVANRLVEAFRQWASQPNVTATIRSGKPMTDAEAKAFGETTMQFGKHTGWQHDAVPLGYLAWLADASRETWLQLHRYLNSPRIKAEREQGDDE